MRKASRKACFSPYPLRVRALLLGVSLLSMAGCAGVTANSPEAAQIRFVHASPEAPALDMYLDGDGAAYNLSFGTVTSYVSVSPGDYHVSAHRGGTGQILVSGASALTASRQYTALLSDTPDNLKESIIPDENSAAPAGTVAVRVINEAASSGPQDVYLAPSGNALSNTAALTHDLGYGATSRYEYVAAGKLYTVIALPAGSTARRVSGAPSVNLGGASGAVRTIILTDPAAKANKGVAALVLSDLDPL